MLNNQEYITTQLEKVLYEILPNYIQKVKKFSLYNYRNNIIKIRSNFRSFRKSKR